MIPSEGTPLSTMDITAPRNHINLVSVDVKSQQSARGIVITTVTRLYIFICLAYCLECHSASESNVFLFQTDFVELAQSFSNFFLSHESPPPPSPQNPPLSLLCIVYSTISLKNGWTTNSGLVRTSWFWLLRRFGPCGINVDGKTEMWVISKANSNTPIKKKVWGRMAFQTASATQKWTTM